MKRLLMLLSLGTLVTVACNVQVISPEDTRSEFEKGLDGLTLEKLFKLPENDQTFDWENTTNRDQVNGDVVFLGLVGGPVFANTSKNYFGNVEVDLSYDYDLSQMVDRSLYNKHQIYYINQAQIYANANTVLFKNSDNITNANAKILNNKTLAMVDEAAKSFKAKGKKVVILGHSYGSFLANEYLYQYGTKNIDSILTAAGRFQMTPQLADIAYNGGISTFYSGPSTYESGPQLDCGEPPYVNAQTVCTLTKDYKTLPIQFQDEFINSSNPNWSPKPEYTAQEQSEISNKVGMFLYLQADLGKRNYTELLKKPLAPIEGSKVFVAYAQGDTAVGKFQPNEIQLINDLSFKSHYTTSGENNNHRVADGIKAYTKQARTNYYLKA